MWEKVSIPYALVALTNLHVGTMENVSDLARNPVYRDAFGFIRINGNVLKGSVRTSFETDRWVNNKQKIISYLFGLGSDSSESRIGSIIFHDFFLFFLSFPHEEYGMVYLTSPSILFESAKLFDLLALFSYNKNISASNTKTLNGQTERYHRLSQYLCSLAMRFLANNEKVKYYAWIYSKDKLYRYGIWLWDFHIPVKHEESMGYLFELKNKIVSEVIEAGLYDSVIDAPIIIIPDYLLKTLLLQSLDITPHVKLEGYKSQDDAIVYNKVVELGPWFQEEIPKFSVFLGGITISLRKHSIDMPKDLILIAKDLCKKLRITKNKMTCDINNLAELALIIDEAFSIPRIIGGNESTGLGLYQLTKISIDNEPPQQQCENSSNTNQTNRNLGEEASILGPDDIWKLIFNELPQLYSTPKVKNKLFTLIDRIRRTGLLGLIAFYIMKSKSSEKGKDKEYGVVLKTVGDIIKRILGDLGSKDDSFTGFHLKLLFDSILCYREKGNNELAESFYDNYYLFIQALNKLRRLL